MAYQLFDRVKSAKRELGIALHRLAENPRLMALVERYRPNV
jgi:hypothetical protein